MRKLYVSVILLTSFLALGGCAELSMAHPGHSDGAMAGAQQNHDMHAMHGGHDAHGVGMHQGMGMPEEHMDAMHEMHRMHQDGYDSAADKDAAASVLRAYSEAINAESIEAMEALVIADDRFSVIEGRGTDIGWANYRDHHLGPEFASERIDFHSYAYDNIDVRAGHIFAYATFTYAFEATLDGEPYNKDGRGTAVLQRTPEGWRIRHLQTS